MKWIDKVKRSAKIDSILPQLGLERKRMNSVSPCPNCDRDYRSKGDKRGPIGVSPNSDGWACFRCGAGGDLVDLVSYSLNKDKFRDVGIQQKSDVKEWFYRNGILQDFNPSKKLISMNSISKPKEKKQEPIQDNSPFKFDIKALAMAHAQLLAGGEVKNYLTLQRGFTVEVIKEFMLGHMIVKGQDWLTIPIKDIKGNIVNCKYRSIPKNGEKKQYRICKGRPLPLFNADKLGSNKKNTLILVEGELDAITMYQYGFKDRVVATTSGAGTNWTDEWLDAVEPYSGYFIWYDNDKAGQEGAEKLASKLGEFRCLNTKSDHNDANTCLQKGLTKDEIDEILLGSDPFIKEELRKVNHYRKELEQLILNPNSLVGKTTGSQKLDKCLGGIRAGLWIITGDTGHGKTTFATWLLKEQATRGVPVMMTSFEQRPIGTVQKLLRMQIGGDFIKVPEAERSKALNQLSSLPLYVLDHYGELGFNNLKNMIKFSKRRYGCEMFLIDHLGFVAKPEKNEDDRHAIERVVRDLVTLSINESVTVMLICHPNNTSVSQQRRVKITDLKGASAIRQDAHVALVVERQDPNQQRTFPASTLHFDKIRSEFGKNGSRVTLAFDPLSCIYADDWNSTPSGSQGKKLVSPVKNSSNP